MSRAPVKAGNGAAGVLYLIDKMGRGGAQTHLLVLASHLDRARFTPAITCLLYEGEMAEAVRAAGVPLEALGARRIYGPTALRAFLRLVRRLRKERPAIVHTYLTSANVFGALAARAAGVPRLLTTRRDTGFGDSPALSRALTLTSRGATRILCVSRDVAEVVARREHADPSRLTVIPNGIDLKRFSPRGRRLEMRRRLGLADAAPVVITVTHITPVKGMDVLARSAASIVERHPEVRFVVVGDGDEPDEASFRRLLDDLGLRDRFLLAGDRTDVPDLLEAADLFVLPSRSEGQPNALIEAMAMGLPVVATRVGGVPEVAADGEEAVLVPPDSPEALASACATVLASADLRCRLGTAARERARREHDAAIMARQYEKLYGEILAEDRS
jgi:glycosyltransferase involved in cell wall biosynthesis